MSSTAGLRVLGVAVPDVSDWRQPLPQGKWSRFFGELGKRLELIDVVRAELSPRRRYVHLARSFHLGGRSSWKQRAGFSRALVKGRTLAAEQAMEPYSGSYELILQLQTLCAPGADRGRIPYAIYTDNTMALTRRLNPSVRLSEDATAWWIAFETDVCRSASTVFTYSEFARRSVIDDYGCPPESVVAVGAGANQLLESLDGQLDRSVPRALFVGGDFAGKGGSVLLEAWPAVRARVPEAELIVAGPKHKPARDLDPSISWMGWLDRDELERLYRSASVFVLPSFFDACPNVLREAMGHGVSCIASDVCAMPEIIDDGVTGLLVPRFESEALAAAMIELLSDPDKARAMGAAAHASVLAGNRWGDVADRVIAHLGQSMGPSAGAAPAGAAIS